MVVLPGVDPSSVVHIPILRKPMQTDTSLTCWGLFHAPEFRFGARDFHSLNPTEKEAFVSAELPLNLGLTHEVLVSKGGIFTFYRNGEKVVSISTPRAVTDCDGDVVLLGSTSIALSSVGFYGRALQPNEVAEMYVGGQPLSELATGSVLSQPLVDSTAQVMAKVDSSADSIEESLDKAQDQTIYNTVLSLSSSSKPLEQMRPCTQLTRQNRLCFQISGWATIFPSGTKRYGRLEVSKQQNMKKAGRNSARGRITPK